MEHAAQARSIRWFYAATDADWDTLFTEQLPRVYNFFRYRVGIQADAEDLTSITFEKAWRDRFLRSWFRSAKTASIDGSQKTLHSWPLLLLSHMSCGILDLAIQ